MAEKYNGWTNYETWNLALWLGNDQGSYEYWRERTREAWDQAEADRSFTRAEQATLDLAKMLEAEIDEGCPEVTGFYADVLSAAIREVDWYEIAEHWIEDEIDEDERKGAEEGEEASE